MVEYPKPDDPLSRFVIGIFRVNGALMRNGDRITKAIGQSSARWHVLGQASFQPQTVASIARNVGHARQSVQRVADLLVREGLATYADNPKDKRAKLLFVTPEGEAAITQINARNAAWAADILPKLDADKLAEMSMHLEQVAAIFEKDEQEKE
ncbi:putative transcriptional regulator, MarR family [Paenibacillus sp. 598K]|uniref:MarR family winged helix-turn-helix transcriptional regulator n=1 Tax=Paenibacillus sp. 598K TaxID=1117987 RepID=UPI000FF9926D|nr:MarR family transcriptional regulator [Paenibacillus sp. 598K]GBF75019.1 putative transcriptional regulator, MarR family [Paenibacillus sp. 598K]